MTDFIGGSNMRYDETLLDPAPLSTEQQRRATLVVCGVADDVAEARMLLRMLGLLEEDEEDGSSQ